MGALSPQLSPMTGFHKTFLWGQGAGADFPSNSGKTGATAQERRSRFAKDAEVVAGWDFERIVPSHGDSIEKDAKKNWLVAFSKVREDLEKDTRMVFCMSILTISPPLSAVPR